MPKLPKLSRPTIKGLNSSNFLLPVLAFILTFSVGFVILHVNSTPVDETTPTTDTSTLGLPTKSVSFTNKYGKVEELRVELATTQAEQEQGLMNRTQMDPDAGMLFVFTTKTPETFWMKDTLIPLDIIFLDENLKVVKIFPTTKANQTEEVYPSTVPVLYGLEANAGWSQTVGLEVGDQISLK